VAAGQIRTPFGGGVTPRAILPPLASISEQNLSSAGKAGFVFMLIFLFFSYSRILDVAFSYLHLPLVLSVLALVAALASGKIFEAISSDIGKCLILLTIWLLLSIPTSVWRGGSAAVFNEQWTRSFMVFPLVATLIITTWQIAKTLRCIGYAVLVLCFLSLWMNELLEGRLMMPQGLFSNPNDLGTASCLGLFCCLFGARSRFSSKFARLICFCALPVMGIVLMKTGSRAAMIGVLAVTPWILKSYTPMGRLKLIGGVLLLLVAALPFTSSLMIQRFFTFFEVDAPSNEFEARNQALAVGSSESRMYLFRRSVEVTLQHPLLGVGMGMFEVAENEAAKSEGNKGIWHGTHNTDTQFSSEAGIPALIFLLAMLVFAWKRLNRVARWRGEGIHPRWEEVKLTALTLKVYLVFLMVSAWFAYFGYLPFLPTLVALIYAFSEAVDKEMKELTAKGAGGQPKPTQNPAFPARAQGPIFGNALPSPWRGLAQSQPRSK